MNMQIPGTEYFTADSVVGISGKPCRVFNMTFLSGGTAGVAVLRNGTSSSGTVFVQETGVISSTETVNWDCGLLFPDGCFWDKGTNVTSAAITYQVEA